MFAVEYGGVLFDHLICPNLDGDDDAPTGFARGSLSFGCNRHHGWEHKCGILGALDGSRFQRNIADAPAGRG